MGGGAADDAGGGVGAVLVLVTREQTAVLVADPERGAPVMVGAWRCCPRVRRSDRAIEVVMVRTTTARERVVGM